LRKNIDGQIYRFREVLAVKSLAVRVKRSCVGLLRVGFFLNLIGKLMKKYVVLVLLALLTMIGAVLEGFVEGLSPQLVQINGLLTLICAVLLIGWTLTVQKGKVSKD